MMHHSRENFLIVTRKPNKNIPLGTYFYNLLGYFNFFLLKFFLLLILGFISIVVFSRRIWYATSLSGHYLRYRSFIPMPGERWMVIHNLYRGSCAKHTQRLERFAMKRRKQPLRPLSTKFANPWKKKQEGGHGGYEHINN